MSNEKYVTHPYQNNIHLYILNKKLNTKAKMRHFIGVVKNLTNELVL